MAFIFIYFIWLLLYIIKLIVLYKIFFESFCCEIRGNSFNSIGFVYFNVGGIHWVWLWWLIWTFFLIFCFRLSIGAGNFFLIISEISTDWVFCMVAVFDRLHCMSFLCTFIAHFRSAIEFYSCLRYFRCWSFMFERTLLCKMVIVIYIC